MYELTQRECLYVATKFNDEARAKLVLRWEILEMNHIRMINAQLKRADESAKKRWLLTSEKRQLDARIESDMQRRRTIVRELNQINLMDYQQLSLDLFDGGTDELLVLFPNKGNLRRIS